MMRSKVNLEAEAEVEADADREWQIERGRGRRRRERETNELKCSFINVVCEKGQENERGKVMKMPHIKR